MARQNNIFKAITQFLEDGYSNVNFRSALNGKQYWHGKIIDTPFWIHRNFKMVDYETEYDEAFNEWNLIIYVTEI